MSFPSPTPKQARVLWFSVTALTLVVVIGLVAMGLGWLLSRLSGVLLPVALALILAYILDPLVEFFVRKKVPRVWSILLVFVLGIVVCACLIGSVVPDLIKESRKLVQVLDAKDFQTHVLQFMEKTPLLKRFTEGGPPAAPLKSPRESAREPAPKNLSNHSNSNNISTNASANTNAGANTNTNVVQISISIKPPAKTNSDGTLQTNSMEFTANNEQLKEAFDSPLTEVIVPALTKTLISAANLIPAQLGKVGIWVEFLIGFILVPVYLFYFLLEKHGINQHWTDYLPITESKAKEELVFVLKAINECMIVFFRGQVLVALCVGVLLTVSYLILGLNYAILLGTVAAVLGVVPYLGTITSLAIALTVAAVQFGDWTHPLIVLGIAAVVKMLEDFLISPKIIGDRSGLHPLTIILAVLIGAKLMGGFLGALVAVPLTAVLRTLMFRYVWKKHPRQSKNSDSKSAAGTAS